LRRTGKKMPGAKPGNKGFRLQWNIYMRAGPGARATTRAAAFPPFLT